MPSGTASTNANSGSRPKFHSEGYLHLVITGFDGDPRKESQERIDAWRVTWECVDGTPRTEDGKECLEANRVVEQMFWNQDPNKSSTLNAEKQTRLLLVTGAITQEDLGKDFNVPDEDMLGRQLVGRFHTNEKNNEIELRFKDMWHIDDNEVKHVPLSKLHVAQAKHRLTAKAVADAANASTSEAVVTQGKIESL